jgi:MoxR-like ATPase
MKSEDLSQLAARIRDNISSVIIGKEKITDMVLVTLFCSGHVLLEDVPGVGKTMIAKCLAKSIDCDFKRVQFTPDLLPSDLTGINFFNQKTCEFEFRPGPLFSEIILADELNRATPRTQSSLLECMEERQITIDGVTRPLSEPFFVIATQNPIETHGTFPLPEAQLDRFFMRLKIGYPAVSDSRKLLDRFENENPFTRITRVATKEQVMDAIRFIPSVSVCPAVKDYITDIVESTRGHRDVSLGVSPRGSLALMKASQAYAAIHGRNFVTPDDVKSVAVPVLSHRIIVKGRSFSRSMEAQESVVCEILDAVPVPLENEDIAGN